MIVLDGPGGVRWSVRRRWMSRARRDRLRLRGTGGFDVPTDLPADGDLMSWLLFAVVTIVVLLVLVPILLFGIELIILGVVLAAGLIGRLVLGLPWTVEAAQLDPPERVLTWQVKGWRRSARLIDRIGGELAAGREPSPDLDPSTPNRGS